MSSLSFAVVALHGSVERVGIIRGITTYPLKGARGKPLDSCSLFVGKSTPRDREYALLRHEHIATRWASAEVVARPTLLPPTRTRFSPRARGKTPRTTATNTSSTSSSQIRLSRIWRRARGRARHLHLDHDTGRVLARIDDVRIDAERRCIESLFAERLETASSDTPPSRLGLGDPSRTSAGKRGARAPPELHADDSLGSRGAPRR